MATSSRDLTPFKAGEGPTLGTIQEISRLLEEARFEPPLSKAEISRRMTARSTRAEAIGAVLDFLESLGFVTQGSKGAQWTLNRDARAWKAVARSRKL